jgi:hypothetical protein
LGTIALIFYELSKRFSLKDKETELRGIQGKPSEVIISISMKKLLKKGHQGVIAQFFSLEVKIDKPSIPLVLQQIFPHHMQLA